MQGLTANFLSEFHQREYIAMRAVGDTDVFLQTMEKLCNDRAVEQFVGGNYVLFDEI